MSWIAGGVLFHRASHGPLAGCPILPPMKLLAVASLSAVLTLACASAPASPAASRPPADSLRSLDPGALAARELAVGFVMIDGVYNSELMAPLDIFHHTVFHTQPGMRVFTVSPSLEPVTSFEGLRILPDFTFEDAPPIDVLVVPSAEHNLDTDLEDEALIEFVRSRGERAAFVMSLCDGAFVLAAAGLLDGLEATTFPSDVPRLREMFSRVEVLEGLSFVHDGRAITSAGGAKSYDPALYLCELLYGAEKARGIARGLVIEWDLDGIAHRRGPH